MRRVALGELAEINPRLSKGAIDAGHLVSFVPMAAVSELSKSIVETKAKPYVEVSKGYTYFDNGDLIVAKITPCYENGKMALAEGLAHSPAFGSTEFHVIRPGEKLLGRFLFHLLQSPAVRVSGKSRMKGAAGQKRVPPDFFKELKVPCPSLPEQKRIAAILDAADALRAKRRETLAQLDTLLQSTFLEMFGDPDTPGWPVETVEDLTLKQKGSIRTGPFGSQLLHSEFVDNGIPVLGIDNAVENEFRPGKPRFITPAKYEKLKRYTVRPKDLLITIMGTCGRCAIVPEDIGVAINTKHLCCISLDQERCLPEYLHAFFLRHPMARRYLQDNAKGAIMSGLNMGIIKRLPVPAPPLAMQRRFATITQAIKQQKSRLRTHLAELDTLFAALQARAFAGEL
ncbi:restriction endonuclease subunit S [Wenzhouxiangella sp. EGI_FJ10409]|uniref:restriction endonuclease subunit S n=1 Tax=Wenzhouxiangella sp. EGI_FJ10409 TaxID=3243767 RepID=UPI0035DBE6BB